MTIFYSSSANQEDILPNLYTREPARVSYPDIPFQGNMMYFHHQSSAPCNLNSHESSEEEATFVANRFSESAYDVWRERRNEMLPMQTVGGSTNDDSQLGILEGANFSLGGSTMGGQGLSLSLGTHVSVPTFHYLPATADISFSVPNQPVPGSHDPCKESLRIKHAHANSSHHSFPYLTSSTLNSQYLKAAQELLHEVVNVRNALNHKFDTRVFGSFKEGDGGSKSNEVLRDDTPCSAMDLSASERQEFQNKVEKLMEMVEEVDRRYMQYHHQMQIVKSSFDVIAGPGAAKPYAALALQTISRHFRCLRDAISAQLQLSRKKLGESENGDGVRLCRLPYIDQRLRQQRAAQQFGMMQPHAWRPQRGLPENSVSILRAWLFEHFLHPYPKDSEKLMLARRTGLTRNQVANWFINARVRLWKPMIEEMHREEVLDADRDSNSSPNKLQKVEDQTVYSTDREEDPQISDAENSKPSNSSDHSKPNPTIQPEKLDHNLMTDRSNPYEGSGRLMPYQMAGLGQYGADTVSLTLGLHRWNSALPVSDGHQSFFPARRSDVYTPNSSPLEANAAMYELTSMGDQRHVCESLHFMQDFVP